MSNTLVSEIRSGYNVVSNALKDIVQLSTGKRDFTDLNKKARENELALYTVVSSTVPAKHYAAVTTAFENEVSQSIIAILQTTYALNPEDFYTFIQRNLTNSDDSVDKFRNAASGIVDSLAEKAGLEVDEFDIELSELAVPEFKMNFGEAVGTRPDDKSITANSIASGEAKLKFRKLQHGGEASTPNPRQGYITMPGRYVSVPVTVASGSNSITVILKIYLRVRMIIADVEILMDAFKSSKERGMFYNYLSMRAGSSPFFRGFILNLKEIQKQVKRDTSRDMAERVVGSLLAKSGFTQPKVMSDISEFRNFSLVITSEDADRLNRELGINITRSSSLKRIFETMNILSLLVLDDTKKRVTVFESDRPTEMSVIELGKLSDRDQLLLGLSR